MSKTKIAIIGAGVAGATSALYLGQLGLDVTLFEKNENISSGPPYCHLHAGGNLYREISDQQCVTLLRQSIEFAKFYPFIIDFRPTVIVLPKNDKGSPQDLLPRLKLLQKEYAKLIREDEKNAVLGKSEEYYKLYSKEDIEMLDEKLESFDLECITEHRERRRRCHRGRNGKHCNHRLIRCRIPVLDHHPQVPAQVFVSADSLGADQDLRCRRHAMLAFERINLFPARQWSVDHPEALPLQQIFRLQTIGAEVLAHDHSVQCGGLFFGREHGQDAFSG